jgi:glycosyltransferase involved in cell wall biosynthesis
VDFTVAICTYDGAQRLPRVLERLRQCYFYMRDRCIQLRWDVLVIDNNSRDQTPEVVANYQATGFADRPLLYIRETTQGLAYARQRAIEAASSPIVGFLDDDNLPEPDWVVAAHEFMLATPRAAAIGSRVLPEYEVEPPANFDQIRGFLALTDRGDHPLLYQPAARVLPPGAGLVVRRDLWLKLVPPRLELIGRVGGFMIASEDLEAILHFQQAGWEIWYNPEMVVYHHIPEWRLTEDYLSRLMYGIGLSRYRTRMMRYPAYQQLPMLLLYTLSDLLRLLRHHWHYGVNWRSSIVAVAQRQLYLGSLRGTVRVIRKIITQAGGWMCATSRSCLK